MKKFVLYFLVGGLLICPTAVSASGTDPDQKETVQRKPYPSPYNFYINEVSVAAISTEDIYYGLSAPDHSVAPRIKDIYRSEICKRNPDWPESIKDSIRQASVQIGMTKDQVLASQGKPHAISRQATTEIVGEIWEYGRGGQKYAFYMENGVVKGWDESYVPMTHQDV